MNLVFQIYDFDGDQLISKADITTIISCMPIVQNANLISEGRFT